MTDKKNLKRADFMNSTDRAAMEGLARTHENCLKQTQRARPGKTAHDRATGAWKPASMRRAMKQTEE